jgi:hypothetical protein
MTKTAYGSPNSMVWEYFAPLRRIGSALYSISDESEKRQNVAICIFLSVTVVEAFLNIYFRTKVAESAFKHHETYFLKTISKPKPLEFKLREWPKVILGASIDFNNGIGKRFLDLKELRNSLMHFTYTYQTIEIENTKIHGLGDIGFYERLTEADAVNSIITAEDFIQEILRLSKYSGDGLTRAMLFWTGKTPA